MKVTEIYQDCSDRINVETNGQFGYNMFNRFSRLAELRLLEWLTGDISAMIPPEPYLSQKNKDWLTSFVVKKKQQVQSGIIVRPDDYYLYQDLYSLTGNFDCESDEQLEITRTPIKLLPTDKFYQRAATFIKGLIPSIEKPIAKQVGREFEFMPTDIGSVTLEYVRYPKFGNIVVKLDEVYNEEVPDEDLSIDYEWDENSREVLVYFIVDSFANRTREQALKTTNIMTGKVVRETK